MASKRKVQDKIVFLDAATVDLGDVDLEPLKRCGSYRDYPHTHPFQILGRCRQANIVVTNKVEFGAAEIKQLPALKLICVAATGVNNIDIKTAHRLGLAVTNVAGYSTQTVAEHALMLILAFGHRLPEHHNASLEGAWSHSSNFTLLNYPFADLEGKTLGIVGYGNIGKRVAHLAQAFGMKPLIAKMPGRRYSSSPARVPLKKLLSSSDFVSLHCPLTQETKYLINKSNLPLMKKSAYLLNLARGPIVKESDVANALKEGVIAGYGTDVLEQEPPPSSHPFFKKAIKDKVLITPHIAWASRESRQRLVGELAKNIHVFQDGKKRNRVV